MRGKPITQSHHPVDPERHARKCSICRSENREEIEAAFLNWVSPRYITSQFSEVSQRMVLHRHVHATGLYEFRRRHLSSSLGRLIERVGSSKVSVECVIRAISAYSRLNNDGQRTDPVQKVVISRRHTDLTVSEEAQANKPHKTILIETPKRVETAATTTKQKENSISTRGKSATSQEPL